jgi:hypothetical protein
VPFIADNDVSIAFKRHPSPGYLIYVNHRDIAIAVLGQGLDPSHVTVGSAMRRRPDTGGAGSGESTDTIDAMAMDAMLSLRVAERDRSGQPIRPNRLARLTRLTQWPSLCAPDNAEH